MTSKHPKYASAGKGKRFPQSVLGSPSHGMKSIIGGVLFFSFLRPYEPVLQAGGADDMDQERKSQLSWD